MTDAARAEDWTRSPARPLAALVLAGLLLAGLALGWSQGRGPAGADRLAERAGSSSTRLIDVNTAPAAQLDLLPGIGPKRAQAIIEERTRGGLFRTLDDLERVHGIGPRTVEKLRGLATAVAGVSEAD